MPVPKPRQIKALFLDFREETHGIWHTHRVQHDRERAESSFAKAYSGETQKSRKIVG
jgi:hypothetical protein